jgi:hypothetical protein
MLVSACVGGGGGGGGGECRVSLELTSHPIYFDLAMNHMLHPPLYYKDVTMIHRTNQIIYSARVKYVFSI